MTMALKSVMERGPFLVTAPSCKPLMSSARYLTPLSSPSCLLTTTLFALSRLSPVIGWDPPRASIVSLHASIAAWAFSLLAVTVQM